MDNTPTSHDEQPQTNSDPSWDKWRNEQIQTISTILSNVFKVEDEVRQSQAPSRLLRNPARQSAGSEKELCEKLSSIRQQISEYEQMLQLSLKRIDNALQVIQPSQPPEPQPKPQQVTLPKLSHMVRLRNWVKRLIT